MNMPRKFNLRTLVVIGALLSMFVLASGALADSVTGTATVQGGSFAYGASDAPDFGTATVGSTDQTLTDDILVTVDDPTGTGQGWNVDIAADQFSDGSGHTLPADALSVTAVSAAATSQSAVAPDNSASSYPITVNTTAANFFDAADNTGMGSFDLTTSLELVVPATTYAGTYTSNVTITAAATP